MQTIGQQITAFLADGEKTSQEMYKAIEAKKGSIDKARMRLLQAGKIEKIAQGLYCLKVPDQMAGGGKNENKNFLPKLDTFNAKLKVKSWKYWTRAERDAYFKALMWEVFIFACQRLDASVIGEEFNAYARVVKLHELFTECAETAHIYHFPLFRLLSNMRYDKNEDTDDVPLARIFGLIYGENSEWVEGKGFRKEES